MLPVNWLTTSGASALLVLSVVSASACGSPAPVPSTPSPTSPARPVAEDVQGVPAEGEVPAVEADPEDAADESIPAESAPGGEAEVEAIRVYRDFFWGRRRLGGGADIPRRRHRPGQFGVRHGRRVAIPGRRVPQGTDTDEFSVSASTDGRDEQWDGLEAVLFLSLPASGSSNASPEGSSFEFTDTTAFDYQPFNDVAAIAYAGDLPEGYTRGHAEPRVAASGLGGRLRRGARIHCGLGVPARGHLFDGVPGGSSLEDSVGGGRSGNRGLRQVHPRKPGSHSVPPGLEGVPRVS